jgi:hypothetical protein
MATKRLLRFEVFICLETNAYTVSSALKLSFKTLSSLQQNLEHFCLINE